MTLRKPWRRQWRARLREEDELQVHAVRYHSSQPWPFLSFLMLGFMAEMDKSRRVPNGEEFAEARWFSRAELRDLDRVGIRLPRLDSIARWLILNWVGERMG